MLKWPRAISWAKRSAVVHSYSPGGGRRPLRSWSSSKSSMWRMLASCFDLGWRMCCGVDPRKSIDTSWLRYTRSLMKRSSRTSQPIDCRCCSWMIRMRLCGRSVASLPQNFEPFERFDAAHTSRSAAAVCGRAIVVAAAAAVAAAACLGRRPAPPAAVAAEGDRRREARERRVRPRAAHPLRRRERPGVAVGVQRRLQREEAGESAQIATTCTVRRDDVRRAPRTGEAELAARAWAFSWRSCTRGAPATIPMRRSGAAGSSKRTTARCAWPSSRGGGAARARSTRASGHAVAPARRRHRRSPRSAPSRSPRRAHGALQQQLAAAAELGVVDRRRAEPAVVARDRVPITMVIHTSYIACSSRGKRREKRKPHGQSSTARARAGAGKYLCVLRLHGFAASRTRNAAVPSAARPAAASSRASESGVGPPGSAAAWMSAPARSDRERALGREELEVVERRRPEAGRTRKARISWWPRCGGGLRGPPCLAPWRRGAAPSGGGVRRRACRHCWWLVRRSPPRWRSRCCPPTTSGVPTVVGLVHVGVRNSFVTISVEDSRP